MKYFRVAAGNSLEMDRTGYVELKMTNTFAVNCSYDFFVLYYGLPPERRAVSFCPFLFYFGCLHKNWLGLRGISTRRSLDLQCEVCQSQCSELEQ